MTNIACYISASYGADNAQRWQGLLSEALGRPMVVRCWPEIGPPDDVEVVLAWKAPAGALTKFPKLRLIVSLGMGVDHLLQDPALPAGIPIVRIMDSGLVGQMAEYALYFALRHHRDMAAYEASQRRGEWKVEPFVDTIDRRVGIMGLGAIGTDVAKKFATIGFPTAGWSRTPRTIDGVQCFHGDAELGNFLARSDILVNVLPLTPTTRGMIDARFLGQLPKGAYLINMGRGPTVVDTDLIAAMDSGHIAGAALDVFHHEPLPAAHAFWTHPKVLVTPHIAGETNPRTAAESVAENIRRMDAGQPLIHTIDRAAGY